MAALFLSTFQIFDNFLDFSTRYKLHMRSSGSDEIYDT